MVNKPSDSGFSWLGRALVGAILGALFGPIYFLDEFSFQAVVSSALAGALFAAALAVFGIFCKQRPIITLLLCGIAGSVAGIVFAYFRDSSIAYGILVGGIFGAVIAVLELRVFASSKGAA